MGSMTDFLELELLDHVLRNEAWSKPSAVYLGLFPTATPPSDSAAGTEVSGNAYARQAVAFDAANARATSNTAVVTFPVATPSGWGTITHFGIFDLSSGGNLLWWGTLTSSRAVDAGKQLEFAAGDIDISFNAGKITTYLANKLLDHSLGTTTYTPPTSIKAALFSDATTDAGGGTELTGNAYARTTATFSVAASGATSNPTAVTFPAATPSGWTAATNGALFDQGTNMLFHNTLGATVTVNANEVFRFPIGDIDVSLD